MCTARTVDCRGTSLRRACKDVPAQYPGGLAAPLAKVLFVGGGSDWVGGSFSVCSAIGVLGEVLGISSWVN